MNREQANRAMQTLEDVFTEDGDAVVIDRIYTFSDPQLPAEARGVNARCNGREHFNVWMPLARLTAKDDL